MSTPATRPQPSRQFLQPPAGIRQRMQGWFWSRAPRSDSHHMVQRNLYILPTGAGWLLLATLLALLVASINYQLNLGYLLTFLVAGCAVVSVPMTHNTLRGLQMHLRPPTAQFAGQPVMLDIHLHNPHRRSRWSIGLRVLDNRDGTGMAAPPSSPIWCDCAAGSHQHVQLAWDVNTRGWHTLPVIHVETRFPLGIFRVWSIWRPASQVLLYPSPEASPPPLPQNSAGAHDAPTHPLQARTPAPEEMPEDIRPYQRGDTPRHIVWKKVAQTGELVSRENRRPETGILWLDWHQANPERGTEVTLQRLCAWVLAASQEQVRFGLRLQTDHASQPALPPDNGPTHEQRCLQMLAEFGLPHAMPAAGTPDGSRHG